MKIGYSWDKYDIEANAEGNSIRLMHENAPRIFYGRRTIKSRARNEVSLPKEGLAARIQKHRIRRYKRSGNEFIKNVC